MLSQYFKGKGMIENIQLTALLFLMVVMVITNTAHKIEVEPPYWGMVILVLSTASLTVVVFVATLIRIWN